MSKLWHRYVRVIEAIAVAGMILILVVGGAQVFFRYVVGQSLFWSEEFMRVAMIWLVMLVAGLAYSRGQFVGMRLLIDLLPRRLSRLADIVSALLMIGLLIVVLWFGVDFAWRTRLRVVPAMEISLLWVHGSIAVGAALLALHILLDTFFGRPFAEPHQDEDHPL